MTELEKRNNNYNIVNNIIKNAIDSGFVASLDIMTADEGCRNNFIAAWFDAENVVRTQILGLEPLKIYNLTDEDDEDYE